MPNVHLVDGTYELFRMYYGAPPAKAEGREVGASRALFRSLLSLISQPEVTHVAVAFDHVIESFRNDLFAGYKTGAGIEEDLRSQFPLAELAAKAAGCVVWPMVEFEADDALATGAARFSEDATTEQVVLCSPDKDLAQMVRDDKIVTLDRRRRILLNEEGVIEKFGVPPNSIPDYLALVGDSADGIPGIPRWGARSAAAVLAHYETIEAIPSEPSQWKVKVRGAAALASGLAERRDDALLYKRLATLRRDVPLTESLSDLAWQGARLDELEEFITLVDDRELKDEVSRFRDER